MKRLLTIIFFLFFITTIYAQSVAGKIVVTIKAGNFNIDKSIVTNGWKLDAVKAVLGNAERRREGFNTTHTYDHYGIVLFEKNSDKVPSGILSEVQFFLAAGDTNVVIPKGFFVGKIQVEDLKVSSTLTYKELMGKLKNYIEIDDDSYMLHNYRLSYKGLYIYFKFNEAENTLLKMSVGKDLKPQK